MGLLSWRWSWPGEPKLALIEVLNDWQWRGSRSELPYQPRLVFCSAVLALLVVPLINVPLAVSVRVATPSFCCLAIFTAWSSSDFRFWRRSPLWPLASKEKKTRECLPRCLTGYIGVACRMRHSRSQQYLRPCNNAGAVRRNAAARLCR